MRVAALYDVHGNLPAFDAVLDEVRALAVDLVVIGGDVLPGPMPFECFERLREMDVPTQCIRGNGDRVVLQAMRGIDTGEVPEAAREPVRWCAEQLAPRHAEALGSWPDTLRMDIPPFGEVLFCHATPTSDTDVFTRLTPEERLLPVFRPVGAPLVVCGHTHMQFDRTVGRTRVVNAGSVGMPFGEPGAYWLLLDSRVELRCTRYDLAAAAERVRATGYPKAAEMADGMLSPSSEQEMLQLFGRVELRWPSAPHGG